MRPNADWGRAATTKHVLTAVNLTKWAILFAPKNENVVKTFCGTFREQAPKMGIQVANPRVVKLKDDRTETFLKELRSIIDPSVQLVVTIFPQLKADRYFYFSTDDTNNCYIVILYFWGVFHYGRKKLRLKTSMKYFKKLLPYFLDNSYKMTLV